MFRITSSIHFFSFWSRCIHHDLDLIQETDVVVDVAHLLAQTVGVFINLQLNRPLFGLDDLVVN